MSASKKNPTNSDIIQLIVDQHRENSKKFDAVNERLDYTNGNVKDLLLWKSNQEAIEKYKKDNPVPTTTVKTEISNQWDWKMVLAILLTLATIFAGIVGVAAK